MKLRPSSLPALTQCSAFEGGSSEFADAGTNRHKAFAKAFANDPEAFTGIPEEEIGGIEWAVEYVKLKAPLADYPISFEARGSFLTSGFEEVSGTADAECGPTVFDLKWRERDYTAQMACYALNQIQKGFERVTVHVLFAERQRAEVLTFDESSALSVVESIIRKVKEHPEPTACDYCSWCAKRLSCEAFSAPALTAIAAREDWKLDTWHPSEITDPAQMAKAVRALPFLRKLIESISFHAREMWLKQGIQIPDCKLQSRAGRRKCADVNGAFGAANLTPEQFLACCDVRFGELEKTYAAANGMKLAPAKRELKRKLDPFVKQSEPSLSVVSTKQIETEEEGEE